MLKKCHGKFECLIYEMLLIRKKRPTLNTQNYSIPSKLFIQNFQFFCLFPSRLFYVILSLTIVYITFTILLQFAFDNGVMSSPKRNFNIATFYSKILPIYL